MSSILNSTKLIRSIKLRAFIPESQKTFEAQDFLDIATEKINITLMKEIITARGDYLIYIKDIPLSEGVQSYAIPARAHGDKLREASIVDSTGVVKRELTQIDLEDLTDYRYNNLGYAVNEPFYLQNNKLVLVNSTFTAGDQLRMHFYMRPNTLVVESRVFTISSISSTVEVDMLSPKSGTITDIALTGELTSAAHDLSTGDKIIITGADSTPAVNGTYTVTVTSPDTFTIGESISVAGTTGSWNLAADVLTVTSSNYPKHFTTSVLYDLVTHQSPNNIKLYDVPVNAVNNATKSLSFRVSDVGTELAVGNYITSAEETFVPNVPTEYHPVVAQMVAVHCMESMADEQQKKSANDTLERMKDDVMSIVQNRVEGAPKKIRNKNGTLAQSVRSGRNIRRGR